MLTRRAFVLLALMMSLIVVGLVGNARAYTAPNIVVTSVYWGTNPLGGISVHPGDTNVPLSIVLSNAGDATARQVNAKLELSPPFSYVYYVAGQQVSAETVEQSAGDIMAGFSFTPRFALTVASDAAPGVHRLNVIVDYQTATELAPVEKSLPVDVPVWTGDVRVQHVLTSPAAVYPGNNQVSLKVWIVNSGTGATNDLQVRLVLQEPFKPSSAGSDMFFLGTMQPGQVSEADFNIDINDAAQFGSYSLKLVTAASGSGEIEIGQVPLYISEKVIFEVVHVEPTVVHAGDSGISIAITIKNTGTVKADSVRAQLRVGNYFSGTLTDFLGTMQPGESKTAYLTVDVDAKAQPQAYKMDLRLDWTQSDYSLDDTLPVEIQVTPAALPIPLIAVAAILIAIVIVVIILRRRRARSSAATH